MWMCSWAKPSLFDTGISSLASRDVRLFVVMIGALTGQGLATLVVIASLTNGGRYQNGAGVAGFLEEFPRKGRR